ncbi:hypothetical protein MPH_01845 [Macrophomina phaseolina MS6]|uniref:Uncharacterized protein n=1 Tax=Macrophomina phaseolina (strain MS6) TaxID=1126212 RepID=K2S7H7_MACPH|nr:hypothetical protein MPH_01845 [Macrophomina phaseolina MS6]
MDSWRKGHVSASSQKCFCETAVSPTQSRPTIWPLLSSCMPPPYISLVSSTAACICFPPPHRPFCPPIEWASTWHQFSTGLRLQSTRQGSAVCSSSTLFGWPLLGRLLHQNRRESQTLLQRSDSKALQSFECSKKKSQRFGARDEIAALGLIAFPLFQAYLLELKKMKKNDQLSGY